MSAKHFLTIVTLYLFGGYAIAQDREAPGCGIMGPPCAGTVSMGYEEECGRIYLDESEDRLRVSRYRKTWRGVVLVDNPFMYPHATYAVEGMAENGVESTPDVLDNAFNKPDGVGLDRELAKEGRYFSFKTLMAHMRYVRLMSVSSSQGSEFLAGRRENNAITIFDVRAIDESECQSPEPSR